MSDLSPAKHLYTMQSPIQDNLEKVYREYIAAILAKDLDKLSSFVSEEVVHNDKRLGLQGYKDLISRNIVETGVDIEIKRLVADKETVAAILIFTTKTETKGLVGIQLDGVPFSFAENVVYDFKAGKIAQVYSVFEIDVVRSHARI